MSTTLSTPEFRFYYFTCRYDETVSFYRDTLQLEVFRSWDRGHCEKGTIFRSPNGTGLLEIEEGSAIPIIQGVIYIEVQDVDAWYEMLVNRKVNIVEAISDTSYGHRSFKFEDPNKLIIGLFKYID